MNFAEAITCDNTDVCETIAGAIIAIALIGAIVYLLLIALSLRAFKKAKRSRKLSSAKKWLWRFWFAVLAVPGIVWIGSLILP